MRRILLLAVLCVPMTASAHFHLDVPTSEWSQTTQGDPQKAGPCGHDGTNGGTSTGSLSTVASGGKLTLTIKETITHPGHYRVAIAQNVAGLPPLPTVTAGATACGSVPIDMNPQLPLLADGVFSHTTAFSGPQTAEIQLPVGFTCDNCVVQVVEFMSNHAAPCFYYHCANVTVTSGPLPQPDAGVSNPGTGDAGTTDPGSTSGGCSTTFDASPFAILCALVLTRHLQRPRRL